MMPSDANAGSSSPHLQESKSNGWRKSWTNPGTATTASAGGSKSKHAKRGSRASSLSIGVYLGRIIFVTVLILVACILGYTTFRLVSTAEENLAETQFHSIAQRALVEAQSTIFRRRWAGVTMANILSELYPSKEQWPFVEALGYERLVRNLLNTSSGEDMGFAVHIQHEQLPQYEEFAYATYEKLGFPNGTGTSPFGRGIWGQNKSLERSDPNYRYHDTASKLLTPIFRLDEGPHPLLMFNPHSGSFQAKAIDSMLNCSRNEDRDEQEVHCASITDIFPPAKFKGQRFGMIIFVPIYPANEDPTVVVGQITPLILVDEMLANVFGDEVSGIDAVLRTESRSVTYTIDNGVARLVGEGDHHDPKYDQQSQTIELLVPSMYTDESPVFWFTLTPNDDFYQAYDTNNAVVSTVVTIWTILLTSLAFWLYDFFVRKEFNAKHELIEARRTFMRFVSHEVRTPLNAVYMGLDLMQLELAKALGFESITALRAAHDFHVEQQQEEAEREPMADTSLLRHSHSAISLTELCASSEEETPTTTKRKKKQPRSLMSRETAFGWFELAHEIQDNTQGAVGILNDLLNYDKIEQGTLSLELGVLSMWDLIETCILEFKLSASSKQINLGLSFVVPNGIMSEIGNASDEESASSCVVARASQLPDSLRQLKVIGDSVRLSQVLRNLMSNALKFTPASGSVQVKVVFQEDSLRGRIANRMVEESVLHGKDKSVNAISRGNIEVSVEDSGAGMSPDQLKKLFQDGVQFNVNELQAGNGSGLGLYIAKGLVTQHKGNLYATSDGLGKGTKFSLVLPMWELAADSDENSKALLGKDENRDSSASATGASSTSGPSGLRVLVVDDISSNRKLLRRLLENSGHQCDDADNGFKAVEMVKLAAESKKPYDSVLMDYEMPVMDGPSAAKEIRQLGFDVYIVGITGNVLPEDITYFRSCGANDVLAKPVKIADLDSSWMEYGLYASSTAR